jgi:hypothetical protein
MRLVQASIDYPGTQADVQPFLVSALSKGGDQYWSLEQVYEQVRSGQWGLWAVVDDDDTVVGAGVTAIQQYGLTRVLEVVLFGAKSQSREWLATLEELKNIGRRLGCSAIRCEGRPGWERTLHAKRLNVFEVEICRHR